MKPKVQKTKKKKREPKAVTHFDYLSLLGKNANKRSGRKALVGLASKDQLLAIAECIENILTGNVPLSKTQLQKLKRHKQVMRTIAGRQLPVHQQKRHLIQYGGFLGSIIPIALSALAPLVGGLFGSHRR